jgi:hypothetical protein
MLIAGMCSVTIGAPIDSVGRADHSISPIQVNGHNSGVEIGTTPLNTSKGFDGTYLGIAIICLIVLFYAVSSVFGITR